MNYDKSRLQEPTTLDLTPEQVEALEKERQSMLDRLRPREHRVMRGRPMVKR